MPWNAPRSLHEKINNIKNNVFILPDSRGCIKKILYHHSPKRLMNKLITEGIFGNFLRAFNKISRNPEAYVITTYFSEEEKEFLRREVKDWENLVEQFKYIEVKVPREFFNEPIYAQDICIILNHPSSAIMTKSNRYIQFKEFMTKTEKLIFDTGLQIKQINEKYTLEGGYLCSTTNHLFFSNPNDRKAVKHFKQAPIFIPSIIDRLIGTLTQREIYVKLPGQPTIQERLHKGLDHVDLMFSFIERDDSTEIFYVDFRESLFSNPYLTINPYLKKGLNEWEKEMNQILKKIQSRIKNARFHKMPGILGFKYHTMLRNRIPMKYVYPYIYSGVNLLFNSTMEKDYAFYLKYPREKEKEENLEINSEIEDVLKRADIIPIPISGVKDAYNIYHIYQSAGIRCLIKALTRENK